VSPENVRSELVWDVEVAAMVAVVGKGDVFVPRGLGSIKRLTVDEEGDAASVVFIASSVD
jgi:hypothetical protein